MELAIKKLLNTHNSGPFMFIGSGFSRRYLGLEDWKSLLIKFCQDIRPFEYYHSSANGELPKVASFMSSDFHQMFWENSKYEEIKKNNLSELINSDSALKVAISDYLEKKSKEIEGKEYLNEIELLKTLNIDGFITTNWDGLLEDIFPDYKVFIGQNELIFSNPQSIGEIYKIHGCTSKPNSLILTDSDYQKFNGRNSYLAAKLITLFVEHPIIFLGYSLSDKNIIGLLQSIVQCLDNEQINTLGKNLIFIKRIESDEEESLSQTIINIENNNIPITLIQLKTFEPLYLALQETKHKIPARVLRYCKEQLYELVQSNQPSTKLCVTNLDAIDNLKDIEFVVGVGLNKEGISNISGTGYDSIGYEDLIRNILFNEKILNAKEILSKTIPNLLSIAVYIPIFKYLREDGINSSSDYEKTYLSLLSKSYTINRKDFYNKNYEAYYKKHYSDKEFKDFITTESKEKIVQCGACFKDKDIDIQSLEVFLKENYNYFLKENKRYETLYRKLICLYDRLKYKWH